MAEWKYACKTIQGMKLDLKLASRDGLQMKLTKAKSGAGKISPAKLMTLSDILEPMQELQMQDVVERLDESVIRIPVILKNKDVVEKYNMYQLGVYAEDPDDGEILYIVLQSDSAEEIPSSEEMKDFTLEWYLNLSVGNTQDVTVVIDETCVLTMEQADAKYVAKDGGNISETIAEFTQAEERKNIESGEKLSVILGKVKKFFTDLKKVAFSGSYNDLSDKPTIPAEVKVKGNEETDFHTGNVNLTPANIGSPSNEYMEEHFVPDYASSSLFYIGSEGVGWYRIAKAKYPYYNSCTITLKRSYNSPGPEYQKIQLMDAYDKHKFISLAAYSHSHLWTKIRETWDSDKSEAYIEIYLNYVTNANGAYKSNNWRISIEDALSAAGENDGAWKAITPAKTEETVDGVEVLASMDLPANFDLSYLVNKNGDSINGLLKFIQNGMLRFISPDVAEDARGIEFYNKNGTERWGGIGVHALNGVPDRIYIGAGTNSPWNPANGLSIMEDSMKWKNSDVVVSKIITSGSFNDITVPGLYTMKGISTNAPTSGNYHSLIVLRSDSGVFVQQIAVREGTTEVYVRYGTSSSWGNWTKLLSAADADSAYAKKSIYGDDAVNLGRKEGTTVGEKSFAVGGNVTASSSYAHAEGYNTTASRSCAHAEGLNTSATGAYSHSEGSQSIATGMYSHAEGTSTSAAGNSAHAEGYNTRAYGYAAHAEGYNTTADNYASHASGKYNKSMTTGGVYNTQVGDVFVIGNGTDLNALSNALRVTYLGDILGTKAFQSSGADYAEFVKPWADGNPENEDRVGYFVTAKDGLLYKANEGDYILGITSGNPSVVGNADEDYYWKYERDAFNRIVMEDVPEEIQAVDEDGNPMFDEETHEPIMTETGNIIKNARMKLAEDYDPSLQEGYIERKDRKEWDYIGMVGVLPVRDDGTCLPGQFCKCGLDGIATLAGERGFDTFYVIERISDNIVSVELR